MMTSRHFQIVGFALLLAGFLALVLLGVGVAAFTWAYVAVPIALSASVFHVRHESIKGFRRGLYIASLCLATTLFVFGVAVISELDPSVRALLRHAEFRLGVLIFAGASAMLGLFGQGWSRAVIPVAAFCSAMLIFLPMLIS